MNFRPLEWAEHIQAPVAGSSIRARIFNVAGEVVASATASLQSDLTWRAQFLLDQAYSGHTYIMRWTRDNPALDTSYAIFVSGDKLVEDQLFANSTDIFPTVSSEILESGSRGVAYMSNASEELAIPTGCPVRMTTVDRDGIWIASYMETEFLGVTEGVCSGNADRHPVITEGPVYARSTEHQWVYGKELVLWGEGRVLCLSASLEDLGLTAPPGSHKISIGYAFQNKDSGEYVGLAMLTSRVVGEFD